MSEIHLQKTASNSQSVMKAFLLLEHTSNFKDINIEFDLSPLHTVQCWFNMGPRPRPQCILLQND